jgi:hypothetical protein
VEKELELSPRQEGNVPQSPDAFKAPRREPPRAERRRNYFRRCALRMLLATTAAVITLTPIIVMTAAFLLFFSMARTASIVTIPVAALIAIPRAAPPCALRKSVHRQIRVEQVRQHVFRRLSVSNDEMKAFYDRHRNEFASRSTATFRELVVNLPSVVDTRASTDASREYDAGLIRFVKAQDRIRAGESFETVARQVSDAQSRAEGGVVGPIDPAELPETVRAALDSLRAGQISAPVRTESAYVLLKLESRTPARAGSFDAARSAVRDRMLAGKRDAALNQLVVALRASALIVWKDSALKAACLALRDPAGG